jgi:predicted permease
VPVVTGGVVATLSPLFALALLGYGFARAGALGPGGARALTAFVVGMAVPALLFRASFDLMHGRSLDAGVIVAFFGGSVVLYALVFLFVRRALRWRAGEAVLAATATTYVNTVMLGIPLAASLYGEAGLLLVSAVLALNGLVMYAGTALLMQAVQAAVPGSVRHHLRPLLANPIIVAVLLGLAYGAGGWPLPGPVVSFVQMLAGALPPVALFTLGAGLAGLRVGAARDPLLVLCTAKLVVHPLLVLAVGRLTGVQGPALEVAVLLAALPAGVNGFLMASRYRLLEARAGGMVLLSTLLSLLSLPVVVALL